MGFEPMRALTPYLVSSEALSTTQPTLREIKFITKMTIKIDPFELIHPARPGANHLKPDYNILPLKKI
jgi:hypothetical protein